MMKHSIRRQLKHSLRLFKLIISTIRPYKHAVKPNPLSMQRQCVLQTLKGILDGDLMLLLVKSHLSDLRKSHEIDSSSETKVHELFHLSAVKSFFNLLLVEKLFLLLKDFFVRNVPQCITFAPGHELELLPLLIRLSEWPLTFPELRKVLFHFLALDIMILL